MKLDEEMLAHIAALSKLRVSHGDRGEMMSSMQKMIDFANALDGIDLDGVPPTTQLLDTGSVFREDEIRESMSRELLLSNAPDTGRD